MSENNEIPVVSAEEAAARAEFIAHYDNALVDVHKLLEDPAEFVLLKATSSREVSFVSMATVGSLEEFVVCILTAIGTEQLNSGAAGIPPEELVSRPELALLVGLKYVNDSTRDMYAEKFVHAPPPAKTAH